MTHNVDVTGPWLVPQEGYLLDEMPLSSFSLVSDWARAGRLIDQEQISITAPPFAGASWTATCGDSTGRGPTALVAAMRAYVTNRLGDEVEIPAELTPPC